MSKRLRIFLADDHAVVREGLRALLDGQPDLQFVGDAADGWSAVQRVTELLPDIAILDISMPGLDGIGAARELKRALSRARILILTIHEDLCYLREALKAGATGYAIKSSGASELIGAIRTVGAGGMYIDPGMTARLGGYSSRSDSVDDLFNGPQLSPREEEVLRLTARGYRNKEMAERLNISVKTVETYRARALDKLKLRTRVEMVRYAMRRGWLCES